MQKAHIFDCNFSIAIRGYIPITAIRVANVFLVTMNKKRKQQPVRQPGAAVYPPAADDFENRSVDSPDPNSVELYTRETKPIAEVVRGFACPVRLALAGCLAAGAKIVSDLPSLQNELFLVAMMAICAYVVRRKPVGDV